MRRSENVDCLECKGWYETRNDHLGTDGEELMVLLMTERRHGWYEEHRSSSVSSFSSSFISMNKNIDVNTYYNNRREHQQQHQNINQHLQPASRGGLLYGVLRGMGCGCVDVSISCALASFDLIPNFFCFSLFFPVWFRLNICKAHLPLYWLLCSY